MSGLCSYFATGLQISAEGAINVFSVTFFGTGFVAYWRQVFTSARCT